MRRDEGAGAARPPRFIEGVFNYCDRWCERCRFQSRCRLYRDTQRLEQMTAGLLDESDLEALDSDDAFELDGTSPPVPPGERAEFLESLTDAVAEVSPAEAARVAAALDRRGRQQTSHPLSREAFEYGETARRLIAVLGPMLRAAGDPLALESLETIGRFALLIAVKTRRAVASLLPPCEELDDDDDFRRLDANGCAKLVRLMVVESRDAWGFLTRLPSVAADGVPAAMIARLDELDQQLARAFPQAMSFVRAGFDAES